MRGGKSIATAVLLAEPDSPWLKAVAGSGDVMELVKITRFSIDPDNPYGSGVVGQAFRDRKLAINADILNSEQATPVARGGSGGQRRRLRGGSRSPRRDKASAC